MRLVAALICLALLGAMSTTSAVAGAAHIWIGPSGPAVMRGFEFAGSQRKSKSPCDAERPPSYCKPKKGAG